MINHKLTNSLRTFWGWLIYTEATLEANEGTRHLSGGVTAHIEGFKPLHDAELEAERQTRKVEAQIAIANLALDQSLTRLHNGLLKAVDLDRQAAPFKRIFADPLSEQTRYGLVEQLHVNRGALQQLEGAEMLYAEEFINAHTPHMRAAIALGEAASEARLTHEIKLADLRLRINDWKQDTNTVLTAVESALNNIASKEKLGSKWPKTFLA